MALAYVEAGAFDTLCSLLPCVADTLADGVGARLMVVRDAAMLDGAVRHHRIRGAMIAVEWHPHAAGVGQLDAVRTGPCEREVGVPEHEPPARDGAHQILLPGRGLGEEALHVRHR